MSTIASYARAAVVVALGWIVAVAVFGLSDREQPREVCNGQEPCTHVLR